jgi:hypothetical protein
MARGAVMPNCGDDPAKRLQQKRRAMKAQQVTFVVKKDPERGYNAHAVRHSIFTQADTAKEMKEMIREAVKCHFDAGERPSRIRVRFPKRTILL